jgi:hypothetical protein
MIDKYFEAIGNKFTQSRDLVIDELSDLFETDQLSESEKKQVVLYLLQTVGNEESPFIVESIFNLFGIAYDDNISRTEIVEKCVDMLGQLEPSSLEHALPIIADSDLVNRKELILKYLGAENPSIKDMARELLIQIDSVDHKSF